MRGSRSRTPDSIQEVQQLAVVDERLRISRDLHDGIIQSIYAVSLSLEDVGDLIADDPAEAAARVDRSIDRLHTTIGDIRTFIVGLGPDEGGGIGGALESMAARAPRGLGDRPQRSTCRARRRSTAGSRPRPATSWSRSRARR